MALSLVFPASAKQDPQAISKTSLFSSQARSLALLLSHMPFAYVLVGDDNGTAQVAQTILALAQMPLRYVLQTTTTPHN